MADVTMPQLGETVTEGTITRWFKQVGDDVALDEVLFEVSTDKVDTEVPSPVAGVLSEILAGEGDLVEVGQVLAVVGEPGQAPSAAPEPAAEESADAAPADAAPSPVEPPSVEAPPAAPLQDAVEPSPAAEPTPAAAAPSSGSKKFRSSAARRAEGIVLSPVVRRLISENDIDPSTLTGTGLGGRITRSDVEQAIRARASAASEAPAAEAPPPPPPPEDPPDRKSVV